MFCAYALIRVKKKKKERKKFAIYKFANKPRIFFKYVSFYALFHMNLIKCNSNLKLIHYCLTA